MTAEEIYEAAMTLPNESKALARGASRRLSGDELGSRGPEGSPGGCSEAERRGPLGAGRDTRRRSRHGPRPEDRQGGFATVWKAWDAEGDERL